MGEWHWAAVAPDTAAPHGFKVSFHARTFGTEQEARDHLQSYLDARSGRDTDCALAAERLRHLSGYTYRVNVHIPGRAWHVLDGEAELKRFVADLQGVVRPVAFRRPAPSAAAAPGRVKRRLGDSSVFQETEVLPEAARAAEEHKLGRHQDTFVMPRFGVFKPKGAGNRVYGFEHGLIRHDEGAAPQVFRWDQIVKVLRSAVTHHFKNGRYTNTTFSYELTRSDGAKTSIDGSCHDPQHKRHANPDSPGMRYARLGLRADERITRILLPDALAALRRGESLAFGKITISAAGVQGKKGLVPWSEITTAEARDGHVVINRAGKFWAVHNRPVLAVSNVSLLLALIDICRRDAG